MSKLFLAEGCLCTTIYAPRSSPPSQNQNVLVTYQDVKRRRGRKKKERARIIMCVSVYKRERERESGDPIPFGRYTTTGRHIYQLDAILLSANPCQVVCAAPDGHGKCQILRLKSETRTRTRKTHHTLHQRSDSSLFFFIYLSFGAFPVRLQ